MFKLVLVTSPSSNLTTRSNLFSLANDPTLKFEFGSGQGFVSGGGSGGGGFIFGLGYTIDEQFNISLSGQQTGNFGETAYGDDNQNLTIQLRVGFYF